MNEIMKTLTIITTIFIPITSIASIYGMNFTDMPGLHWHYGYASVICGMVLITVIMIIYFWKKNGFLSNINSNTRWPWEYNTTAPRYHYELCRIRYIKFNCDGWFCSCNRKSNRQRPSERSA